MPAYSYKERFVPFVKDGSKPHTIRSRRKKGFAKKGDQLYHYFGLRTKFCKKLRQDVCTDVKTILISENANNDNKLVILLYNSRFTNDEFEIKEDGSICLYTKQTPILLTDIYADRLAWRDGFRPEGSTHDNTAGAAELMQRWFKQTHGLPFIGDIIYWNNSQEL